MNLLLNCSGNAVSTSSSSGVAPGVDTLHSLVLLVIIVVSSASDPRYNWQPSVLSTRIVGTLPVDCTSTDLQLTTSIDDTTSVQTILVFSQSSNRIALILPLI